MEDLTSNSLAVVGIPMEENTGADVGCRLTPQALRETSVYFGWHANPQFSHPVDVDVRKQISTSSIHERMTDVGDIPVEGLSSLAASNAIEETICAIRNRGAASIVLSGDTHAVKTIVRAQSKNETLGFVQIGGRMSPSLLEADETGRSFIGDFVSEGLLEPSNIAMIAPARAPSREGARQLRDHGSYLFSANQVMSMPAHEIGSAFQTISQSVDSMIVHLDLSAVASQLHGMSPIRRIDGVTVPKLQALLTDVGQTPVSTLIVTGMNPTVNGMSIVKTGQRLLMAALLGYIYGRLGILKSLQREEVEYANK
jgi:agmatinase